MRHVRHIKKTRTYHHILMCEYVHHLENRMTKNQTYALKMKLSSLNIRLIDARALNKPTEELQSKFDALLAKLRQN